MTRITLLVLATLASFAAGAADVYVISGSGRGRHVVRVRRR
jgi:hypothetical protein